MGFFDFDGASGITGVSRRSTRHGSSSSKHHSHSHRDRDRERDRGEKHDRDRDRDRDRSGSRTRSVHSNITARGFFGLPNVSSRSIFSTFSRAGGASSYYRRQPRSSFVQRAFKKLKRLLRDLVYYAKKHPLRVFMLAIMPLITGGALTALLARFGLRMPKSLESMTGMAGMGARAMSGPSVGLVGEAMRMAAVAGTGGGAAGAAAKAVGGGFGGIGSSLGGIGSSLGGITKMFS